MYNFNEILKAFLISYKPTKLQSELAEKRLSICNTCDSKKLVLKKFIPTHICGGCKCVIQKKIYTPLKNTCPLNKWNEIESEKYFPSEKENKSII
jgi:hypothetical protein